VKSGVLGSFFRGYDSLLLEGRQGSKFTIVRNSLAFLDMNLNSQCSKLNVCSAKLQQNFPPFSPLS
jgi:hypothetical protein